MELKNVFNFIEKGFVINCRPLLDFVQAPSTIVKGLGAKSIFLLSSPLTMNLTRDHISRFGGRFPASLYRSWSANIKSLLTTVLLGGPGNPGGPGGPVIPVRPLLPDGPC